MNTPSHNPWDKLVSAARSVPANTGAESPPGFSTRVVARAFAERPAGVESLFARFSLPALGVAALITTLTVATNLKPVLETADDDVAALSEPVIEDGDLSV